MKGEQFRPIEARYLDQWRERIEAEQFEAAVKKQKRKPKPSKKKEESK